MDLSNSNKCKGDTSPSDCPYNFYRTSGDIGPHWGNVIANLGSTVSFLGGDRPLSRPGAWAYPDMLEVGNLVNATESRSHFGAWAIMSSPLILSFDLRDDTKMDAMWPIITNRDVIAVNQRWAGHPGTRLSASDASQLWAKPLGNSTHAVFLVATSDTTASFSLPFRNVSKDLDSNTTLCVRDLYSKEDTLFDPTAQNLEAQVSPHDSALYCVCPVPSGNCEGDLGACPAFSGTPRSTEMHI